MKRWMPTLVLLCLGAPLWAQQTPFAHLQLDKPRYQLGETVWFRAHGDLELRKGELEVLDAQGEVVATPAPDRTGAGSFFLDPKHPGGTYQLVLTRAGCMLHAVPFQVYDLRSRQLNLSLRILGDYVYPGEELRATLFVRDLAGNPLPGLKAKYRASFGSLVLQGSTEASDSEGGILLRLTLPKEALDSGHLSLGVKHKGKLEAIAQPVTVSGSVGSVEFFPEGGSVVPGHPHRVALLVRDKDGLPAPAEGRLVDSQGHVVDVVQADRFGHALVVVPYSKDERYSVRIERPAGVQQEFVLPGATGHPFALQLEHGVSERLRVWVWGERTAKKLEVLLVRDGQIVETAALGYRKGGGLVSVDFPSVPDYAVDTILLVEKDRVLLKALTVRGQRWPLTVEIKPAKGIQLGGQAAFEVLTRRGDQPVSADLALSVFRHPGADLKRLTALPARMLLAEHTGGFVPDEAIALFPAPKKETEQVRRAREKKGQVRVRDGAKERRDAFLMVRSAWSYPTEGLARQADGLPAADQGRRLPKQINRRVRTVPSGRVTRTRSKLDRLLARASFTLPTRPSLPDRQRFGPSRPTDPPGLGRPARVPPQHAKVRGGSIDTRDCLSWEASVKTGPSGRALIQFPCGDQLARLAVLCQGVSGGQGLGTDGAVLPDMPFQAELTFPSHLRVGDIVDASVTIKVRDRNPAPITLVLRLPSCLRTRERTVLTYRPGKDKPTIKFPLEVVSAVEAVRLRVLTRRGPLQAELSWPFSVSHLEQQLTLGRTGIARAALGSKARITEAFRLNLPAAALPGSVEVFASVAPVSLPAAPKVQTRVRPKGPPPTPADVFSSLESMLRTPTGCFAQTSASNWPNLVVLETLLETGADPHALENAYTLAKKGYRRLGTFQTKGGGFALYPGQSPSVPYTALAVPQLSATMRVLQGKGAVRLERAVHWLSKQKISEQEVARVTMALHEAGRSWPGSERVLEVEPRSAYQRVLLARCLASWVGPWSGETPKEVLIAEQVAALSALQQADGLIPSQGEGIMGSRGRQLDLETTALAVPFLVAAKETDAASLALVGLAAQRRPGGGWGSTRSTALVVRAFAHVVNVETEGLIISELRKQRAMVQPNRVAFVVNGSRSELLVGGRRDRAVTVSRRLDSAAGRAVSMTFSARGPRALSYRFGARYRVKDPSTSPQAPFTIQTSLQSTTTHVGAKDVFLRVTLKRTGKPIGGGQVVAKIGIPGGFKLDDSEATGCARLEQESGYAVLYWERPRDVPSTVRLPLRPIVVGHFRASPSVIYPYYESGREAYAPGLVVRVNGFFDPYGTAEPSAEGG